MFLKITLIYCQEEGYRCGEGNETKISIRRPLHNRDNDGLDEEGSSSDGKKMDLRYSWDPEFIGHSYGLTRRDEGKKGISMTSWYCR